MTTPKTHPGPMVLVAGHWRHLPPTAADINLREIVSAACTLQRFNGQLRTGFSDLPAFVTLGHHLLAGVLHMTANGQDVEVIREFFAHDLHEVWMGDLISPIKHLSPALAAIWKDIECTVEAPIRSFLGLPLEIPPEHKEIVKKYDTLAITLETTAVGCYHHQLDRITAWHGEIPSQQALDIYRQICSETYATPALLMGQAKRLFPGKVV